MEGIKFKKNEVVTGLRPEYRILITSNQLDLVLNSEVILINFCNNN